MPGFLKAIREAAAAAPVNQDLVFTRRKLWDDIERTLWALETAQNHFEQATEPVADRLLYLRMECRAAALSVFTEKIQKHGGLTT